MTKYQFIKSKLQVAQELHNLWDNYPLYKFINGAQWIRKRELDISECLIDREDWIEVCRTTWLQKQLDNIAKKKP
jgi:hypothetical protein